MMSFSEIGGLTPLQCCFIVNNSVMGSDPLKYILTEAFRHAARQLIFLRSDARLSVGCVLVTIDDSVVGVKNALDIIDQILRHQADIIR